MTETNDERAKFEAWARDNHWRTDRYTTSQASLYGSQSTQDGWYAWQARASLAVPPEAPREPLLHELETIAARIDRAYGGLPATEFPGPPGAICTRLEEIAAELRRALPVAAPMKEEWLKEAERLIEDYAGARAETAVHNVTQCNGTFRMARPRLAALLSHLRTAPLEQRELSDEQMESLIENSGGAWHEDVFHIESGDLCGLIRAASAAPQQQPEQPNTELPHLAQVSGSDATARDAARYRWLWGRLLAADFAWGDPPQPVLVFAWPKDVPVSGNCDSNIDAAMPPVTASEPSASDFAKIMRATDGEQVLFRKGSDANGDPCLFQTTSIDGMTAEIAISFKSGDWDALDAAFDNADADQADGVRSAAGSFIGGPRA